jgi:hypothetical protein
VGEIGIEREDEMGLRHGRMELSIGDRESCSSSEFVVVQHNRKEALP